MWPQVPRSRARIRLRPPDRRRCARRPARRAASPAPPCRALRRRRRARGDAGLGIGQLLAQDGAEQNPMRLDDRLGVLGRADAGRRDALEALDGGARAHIVADRERARRRDQRQQAALLQVRAPLHVAADVAEQGQGRAPVAGKLAQQLHEGWVLAAGVIGVVPDRLAQRQRTVHRHAIEEDVDVEQVLRPLPAHPAVDRRLPARNAHAPLGIARHHATLAEGHSGGIEHGGNLDPERLEPLVLGGTGLASLVDDGVVLICRQQGFAAAGRAEHKDGIADRRRSLAGLRQARLGKLRGTPRQDADLGADDARDHARIDRVGQQAGCERRQPRPGLRQLGDVAGAVDLIAENDRGRCPVTQQVARRDGAGELALGIAHGEMAEAQPLHAADGAIEEVVLLHRLQRPLGDCSRSVRPGPPVRGRRSRAADRVP